MIRQMLDDLDLKEMDAAQLSSALMLEVANAHPGDYAALSRVLEAVSFASTMHHGQTRANRGVFDRTVYIEHPLRVALRTWRRGILWMDAIVAAILHDTVEDGIENFARMTGRTFADEHEGRSAILAYICGRFGATVAATVARVSNPIVEPGRQRSRAEKVAEYAEHIRDEIISDLLAFIVKLGDFEDNALGLHHNLIPGRERQIARMAVKYLAGAAELVLGFPMMRQHPDIVPSSVVDEYEQRLEVGRLRLEDLALAA